MAEDLDLETSELLDGLEGDARSERAELIRWLIGRGVGIDQISGNPAPMLLASRRVIGDDGQYVSARQAAADAGVDLELFERIQRAMGLPRVDDADAQVFLRADAEAAKFTRDFLDAGIDPDELVQITRLLGDGLSRAAEAMRYAALAAVIRPGATELEIAQQSEALVAGLAPLLGPMIQEVLLLQLRHAIETEAVNATERAEGQHLPGARLVTIGFADLVGFTRLGEAVPPEDLEQLSKRLADMTREFAVAPVRFIKTIGDEVMLVSPEPAPLLDTLLRLVDETEDDDDFPRLRAGVATGLAVSRAGDWFGSPVNLAARVTGAARPGSVLVAEATREAVGEDERFTWSFAGGKHLKGFKSDVKTFRARRTTNL
ncbi:MULTISPECIES: adenylate/guanylate cyclase domain-containing protein [Mycolicibacterium]|uniref:adenylate/guanylate cyclase domain-containing protein n=1 Tax=Mycolicibacterium TaxID=1866885 RepID=UPI00056D6827|nr:MULTISPECIES: adenylate/guanylate cyclase domain-containing protein [Mycolicibacterium]QZY46403.1 adenylate/guanylate cyclase domain-containing protein [Mycolicibacterium austroafricanum]UJL28589.1 adenylate/guanylate cyclase domain-containing protein [Mycolicibacterium vanbaalenii]WND55289.1 adenylate/guanylate cyclase domain-containing protein [Mycolicibacterium vanbaalenii]